MSTKKTGVLFHALGSEKAKPTAAKSNSDTLAKDKHPIVLRLDPADARRLKAMSVESNTSMQAMLEEAINDWLAARGLQTISTGREND